MIRYGIENCDHDWVLRIDGYEETCGAAICRICGAFGCYCDALKDIPLDNWNNKMKEMSKKGLYSYSDTNGNWINPYVKLKETDLRNLLLK